MVIQEPRENNRVILNNWMSAGFRCRLMKVKMPGRRGNAYMDEGGVGISTGCIQRCRHFMARKYMTWEYWKLTLTNCLVFNQDTFKHFAFNHFQDSLLQIEFFNYNWSRSPYTEVPSSSSEWSSNEGESSALVIFECNNVI